MVDKKYGIGLYNVSIEHDYEEDNVKAFTEVTTPDGNRHLLDITPYWPSDELILRMIQFHEKYGYFVTRSETQSGGPVELHELEKVEKLAAEHQFDNADDKIYD